MGIFLGSYSSRCKDLVRHDLWARGQEMQGWWSKDCTLKVSKTGTNIDPQYGAVSIQIVYSQVGTSNSKVGLLSEGNCPPIVTADQLISLL